jgi:hypothetical protein
MSENSVEAHREAVRAEYSKYVATEVITIDGVRAFNPGDAVPVSHVDRGVVSQDQVAGTNTKAAKAATTQES